MEKPYKNTDPFFKRILHEAGLEKPSADFSKKVMLSIEERASVKLVYKPLIPKYFWILFVVILVSAGIVIYFVPVESFFGLDISENIFQKKLPSFSFPEIRFSKITVYGTLFLLMFLIQIPFLKKYIEKTN